MAYEKLCLMDGQVLKAEHLEHIENGILEAERKAEQGGGGSGGTGYTPQKGVDYWTAEDIAQIKSYVDDAILGGAW